MIVKTFLQSYNERMKELKFTCSCGCKAQCMIQSVGNGQIMIDTRIDGRRRWTGVVLNEKEIKQIKNWLQFVLQPETKS